MNNPFRFVGFLAALLMSANVYAGDIQVENAWARATAPSQDMGSVDLTITSKQAAMLVGASSAACKSVELHSMMKARDSDMMQMREVNDIALPAGKPMNLGNSGYHLMLIGLKAPLKEDDKLQLTLDIKVAGHMKKVKVVAKVMPLTATGPAMGGMQPMDGMQPMGEMRPSGY